MKLKDFISEIINLYNKFDYELLIKKITEMSYSFFNLIKENKSISDIDRTDVLSFIKSMKNNNNFKLPYFILPIVALNKKIYLDKDDSDDEDDDGSLTKLKDAFTSALMGPDISATDIETELVEKYNSMYADGNGYKLTLDALFNTKYNSYKNNLIKMDL